MTNKKNKKRNKKKFDKRKSLREILHSVATISIDDLLEKLAERVPSLAVVSNVEKVTFTKNLSVLIKSGVDMSEAMQVMEEQASWALRGIIKKIRVAVEGGQPLSDALSQYPRVFSELYVNIIMAGERSGTLEESLHSLSSQLTKSHELRTKIKAAMMYPIIVLSITLFVGLALGMFVLPKLSTLFKSLNTELPFLTRAIIKISDFLSHYGAWVFVGVIVGIILFIWFLRLPKIKPIVHRLLLMLPMIGKIVKYMNLAVLNRTLSTLLKSGIPITDSITITARVISNIQYQRKLHEIIESVSSGGGISYSLEKNSFFFPPLVYRMIRVGEETGQLEDVLLYLADFYEAEVDNATKYIYTIIEPVLLFIIGILLTGVALGIISPIYQVIDSIQSGI